MEGSKVRLSVLAILLLAFVRVVPVDSSGLDWSSFLGGSSWDYGYSTTVDDYDNIYVTGYTYSSNFPTSDDAYDRSYNSGYDVFITKMNPLISGEGALVYSTYLGSTGGEQGMGIAVDESGNAYVTGWTSSADFPITLGAYDTTKNDAEDVFLTKLNSTGTALIYSTFLGSSNNERALSLAIDSVGNAYLTGWTSSYNFPTTTGAYDETHNGAKDVFMAKINPAGNGSDDLLYSTFLGGSNDEEGTNIALDDTRSAYVTGWTVSINFPTPGAAFDTTHNGLHDVFVTKLNAAGTDLHYSTYLGGSLDDEGQGITVDSGRNAYVTGWARSTNFPTTLGCYDPVHNGNHDVFVTKLDPAGSVLLYSTYLGGSTDDEGWDITVDSLNHAYVTGRTQSYNFPTVSNAYDTDYNGGAYDVFVAKINPAGNCLGDLFYSTYLGGSGDDHGYGIALDPSENVYVTGPTSSYDFPTTPEAYDTISNGAVDTFISKLSLPASPPPAPTCTPTATPSPTPYEWLFEPPPDGWSYRTAVPPPDMPDWDHATSVQVTLPGALGAIAPVDETTNHYGSWDNYSGDSNIPAISWVDNSIWRAIFTMSSDKSDPSTVPSIRLRFALNHMKATSYIQVLPGGWLPVAQRGGSVAIPMGTLNGRPHRSEDATDYKLYLRPPIVDNGFFLAFDLIDFGQPFGVPCDGTVYLEEVIVDRFDLTDPSIDDYWTTVTTYSGARLHSWTHSSAGVPYLTEVDSYTTTTDGLQQVTTIAQTRPFGAWTSPSGEVDLITGQFYRAVWKLACEDSSLGGAERVRMHTVDFRYSSYMVVDRDADPANSALPPSTGKDYYIYAEFPGTPTVDKLLLAWDLFEFDPNAGGWARLTDVMVSRKDLP